MKKVIRPALILIAFIFMSCMSTPISTTDKNYLSVGKVESSLINDKDQRYFVAYGTVNLYILGGVVGQTNTSVVLLVDPTTGRIIRIITMQPTTTTVSSYSSPKTVTTYNNGTYSTTQIPGQNNVSYIHRQKIDDLVGGILVKEIHPAESFADAASQLF
jgi:hypothetical protein